MVVLVGIEVRVSLRRLGVTYVDEEEEEGEGEEEEE